MSDDARARSIDLAGRVTLRPTEAALALGLSERTLRTLMKRREIPFFHYGDAVLLRVEALRTWAEHRERLESGGAGAPLVAGASTPSSVSAIAGERHAEVDQHTRALASRIKARLGPA